MSADPVNVFCQAGELLKVRLEGYDPLSGFTVINDQSSDIAVDEVECDAILIQFIADNPDTDFGNGQTSHRATFDIEVLTRGAGSGQTLQRRGLDAVAHIVAAVALDRQFDRWFGDVQEVDLGSTEANGKDADGVSMQFRVEFVTARDDWFTIIPV